MLITKIISEEKPIFTPVSKWLRMYCITIQKKIFSHNFISNLYLKQSQNCSTKNNHLQHNYVFSQQTMKTELVRNVRDTVIEQCSKVNIVLLCT